MEQKLYKINLLPPRISIGYVGENDFRGVLIDCADWLKDYPSGVIGAVYQRPDDQTYPVVLTQVGTVVAWRPSSLDLTTPGYGAVKLEIRSGDVVGRSATVSVYVSPSLTPGGTPTPPPADWLEQILAAAATATSKAAEAAESAEAAEAAAQQVEEAIPAGGTTGQVLKKKSNTDFDTEWADESGGGGSSDELWRPTVAADGTISWEKSTSTTPPQSRNIKGPQGPAGADGQDGQPGQDGEDGSDGVTFTPAVSAEGVISWTNDGGRQNPTPVNIKGPQGPAGADGQDGQPGQDGAPGADGEDGSDGVTFTPAVSAEGVISWTNDGGRQNPPPVNIKGPQGIQGVPGIPGADGEDGEDGRTPVKGTDYWTSADKQEIVQDVLDALPTWTGGSY